MHSNCSDEYSVSPTGELKAHDTRHEVFGSGAANSDAGDEGEEGIECRKVKNVFLPSPLQMMNTILIVYHAGIGVHSVFKEKALVLHIAREDKKKQESQ